MRRLYGKLTRIQSAGFKIEQSVKIDEVENLVKTGRLNDILIPVDRMFLEYDKCVVLDKASKKIYNGNLFLTADIKECSDYKEKQKVRVYDETDVFVGIYEYDGNVFKPVKMFL